MGKRDKENLYKKEGRVCIDNSKGFLDLIHHNTITGEIIFVELKGGKHKFHAFQKQMMKILVEGKNRKAYVVTYDDKSKKFIDKPNTLEMKHDNNWEGVESIGILDKK